MNIPHSDPKAQPAPQDLGVLTWGLNALMRSGEALAHSTSSSDLMQDICVAITQQPDYVLAWIGLAINDAKKSVDVVGLSGSASAYAQGIEVSYSELHPNGNGPIGRCIRTGKAWLISDTETDPNFEPWRMRARKHGIRSVIAVPIRKDGVVIGALGIYSSSANAFTVLEEHIFSNLAAELGFGLGAFEKQEWLRAQEEKLRNALTNIIEVMSKTMDLRDPYTAGHQKNVAIIARAIASLLGWSSDKLYGLELAAMVHDIGKIAVPSEILTKPSRLSEFEEKLLQEHPENGYQLLRDIEFPWPIAQMVRQHHERIDGSGYPMGLKGDEILPEAKVLAVADTIEAMAAARPYRFALGLKAAMTEIKKQRAIQLDPQVVDAALALFEGKESIEEVLQVGGVNHYPASNKAADYLK